MDDAVRTTCPYCGVGCGILARTRADGSTEIAGDPEHPANFGRLCSKGSALGETLSFDGRVLQPLMGGERASWDEALDLVASKFSAAIAEHGPESVAFYVSGQFLTEDYYVANKLMKGFIGAANIDTNSRLCMASSVAGHKRAFGSDTVPGNYSDIEQADLVVLVGSNLAWCHPVLYQRLMAAREGRATKLVVVDPRGTVTSQDADLHLPLAPGSDVALFNGLLTYLADRGRLDSEYIAEFTRGFDTALDLARAADPVAETGLSPAQVQAFYALFAAHDRVVTIYSQGVNQSINGTDKVNAIINCHLATGRIGRPGMGPFSVTGQPNAMGGREVGGLSNTLAAHMDFADPAHLEIVRDFWQAPRLATEPGLKAVDLFRAVADGKIKALWIMATNPVDSLPDADVVRDALAKCEFVVVSDVVRHTDTTEHAHVLLPAAAWGEKDGTVTNSERRISRQRRFLAMPGEARPDWWQICEVAKRMGFAEHFNYSGPSEIYAEHARLTGVGNEGSRDFDIGAHGEISQADYDALTSFQWPLPAGRQPHETRFFARGNFFTPDRRARFIATPVLATAFAADPDRPLILNTGRIRDQWHTMTRTSKTPRLMNHIAEPFLEISPHDAAVRGLTPADLCEVSSAHGRALLRVLITPRQLAGRVFAPMHWTGQHASAGRVGAVIDARVDPHSGQPELKRMPVQVRRFAARFHGFAVSVHKPEAPGSEYWALAPARGGWRLEFAGETAPENWDATARALFRTRDAELLAYHDTARDVHRFAAFTGDRFLGALFVGPEPVPLARGWLADLLSAPAMDAHARLAVLAGRASASEPDQGPIVCACFDVGRHRIAAAVASGHASVAAIGVATSAGTNCGSCRSEIGGIIDATRLAHAV
jgi:assimilatory nitrate reductase catalytic subunit